MIKIVIPAGVKSMYVKTCNKCGCSFRYDLTDTILISDPVNPARQQHVFDDYRTVTCPQCQKKIIH